MKSSNIGGQAVLEGIMMRNGGKYSVAVRKTDGEIALDVQDYKSVLPWQAPLKIPFIRGIFNFVDSLVLGMKTLMFSASFFEDEEEAYQIHPKKSEYINLSQNCLHLWKPKDHELGELVKNE